MHNERCTPGSARGARRPTRGNPGKAPRAYSPVTDRVKSRPFGAVKWGWSHGILVASRASSRALGAARPLTRQRFRRVGYYAGKAGFPATGQLRRISARGSDHRKGAFSEPRSQRSTVRRACRRTGLPELGAHQLRHTAACEMVAAHVPLVRIGQVLRHRSLQSTAIYARMDVDRLRQLARPWPRQEVEQ